MARKNKKRGNNSAKNKKYQDNANKVISDTEFGQLLKDIVTEDPRGFIKRDIKYFILIPVILLGVSLLIYLLLLDREVHIIFSILLIPVYIIIVILPIYLLVLAIIPTIWRLIFYRFIWHRVSVYESGVVIWNKRGQMRLNFLDIKGIEYGEAMMTDTIYVRILRDNAKTIKIRFTELDFYQLDLAFANFITKEITPENISAVKMSFSAKGYLIMEGGVLHYKGRSLALSQIKCTEKKEIPCGKGRLEIIVIYHIISAKHDITVPTGEIMNMRAFKKIIDIAEVVRIREYRKNQL